MFRYQLTKIGMNHISRCYHSRNIKHINRDEQQLERSLNVVELIGRINTFKSIENKYSVFSLATKVYLNNDGTEEDGPDISKELTQWHTIRIYKDDLRELFENKMNKGDRVFVSGSLHYAKFDKSPSSYVLCNKIILLTKNLTDEEQQINLNDENYQEEDEEEEEEEDEEEEGVELDYENEEPEHHRQKQHPSKRVQQHQHQQPQQQKSGNSRGREPVTQINLNKKETSDVFNTKNKKKMF
jgi:single-stranded DNA-binding protein